MRISDWSSDVCSSDLDDDAPVLHPRFGSNLVFDVERGDAAAVADAFEIGDHVTELELLNNRVAPSPMEPRSILASYDPSEDRYTIWTPSQNPHSLRFWLANDSLFVPQHKPPVVAPDFGGSFGQRSR